MAAASEPAESDYIVIGAGSAGSAVAKRLTEIPGATVTLIEAGPPDRNPWLHVPIGYARTMFHPVLSWNYRTAPEPELDGRAIPWPRGRVLGGSSAINGLLYVRGQAEDYDHWRQLGCIGWSYADVLPFFRRAEDNERGACAHHGAGGPLAVSDLRDRNPIAAAFIAAALELGFPENPDFNGPTQEGAGWFQVTARRGWRCSAYTAYLRPRPPNLRLLTEALALRLTFTGRRCSGVLVRQGGREFALSARREVVLCGGAVNSPQLLMLSGIGDATELAALGIPVLHHAPEVGRNLQDHLQARVVFRATRPVTVNDMMASLPRKLAAGLHFALRRRGPLTFSAGQAGLFARVLPGSATPDVQYHFIPFSSDRPGEPLHPFSGFTISVCQLRPESRGRIALKSPKPEDPPLIEARYLSAETDRRCMVAGLRLIRRLAATRALSRWIAAEYAPGPQAEGDEALLAFCRATAGTIYHPAGSCRMGEDPGAVVDSRLRVRGVEGLRVADASIMPTVVSGNTNAACIMIGEKCAAMMREAA
ncbi:MAG: GMC family oxidoreductase N-terminal domain-containing protein [Rhodovarius sp.]|nr:GMC family oxidoreductase N-terminal domain-containing protein [Rhodovarius sp.]MCX7932962.1 GMC family oxidoreductase N-terminal domain-containing protein [Rhodovarius sp.]MDW8315403.1 GMC family oxidoreductase N-terminal domain-containing protein [Rhodovarius sp.]